MCKERIYNLIIAVVLLILILFRACGDVEDGVIAGFNFVGMAIALITVFFRVENNARERHKPWWFLVIFLLIIAAVILSVCVFCKIIILSATLNDVITLLALFFSIPADLYVALLSPQKY